MNFKTFVKDIADISEQLYVEKDEGLTKVLWVYAGFDMIEEIKPKSEKEPSVRKKITDFLRDGQRPKYHTIAHISETKECVFQVDVNGRYVPENVRKEILAPLVSYVETPLVDRHPEEDQAVIKSPEKLPNEDGEE